jgi:type III secretory pathway lipoprotein EscJ
VGDERKGKGSFIPSREEQWFQYESQVAESLEATLLTLPGVVDAHVHLKLPPSDPLLGTRDAGQGSGSVLLILESDSRVAHVHEDDIAKVVAGGAGIPVGRVRVLKSSSSGVGEEDLGGFGRAASGIAGVKREEINLSEEANLMSKASDVDGVASATPHVALVKSGDASVAAATNLIAKKTKFPYSKFLMIGVAVGAGLLCVGVVVILVRRSRKKREIFALRKNDLLGEIA